MSKEDFYMWKRLGYKSYGQYMIQKPFSPYRRESGKKCANCGGVLSGGQLKFCCSECRAEMKSKTNRGDLFV